MIVLADLVVIATLALVHGASGLARLSAGWGGGAAWGLLGVLVFLALVVPWDAATAAAVTPRPERGPGARPWRWPSRTVPGAGAGPRCR